MITRMIEATQAIEGGFNFGKFMVGRFSADEWARQSELEAAHGWGISLLTRCGWTRAHLWVLDLQTGEGACFRPGGFAAADLEKHRIWVCPMFQPFLEWLYCQDLGDLEALPAIVELPTAEPAMAGYRRSGRR